MERWKRSQLAFGDRRIDARQVLIDDSSSADIGVADFGVSHLAVGKPDILLARLQMGMRPARHQAMPVGRTRLRDCVIVGFGPLAPTVEDAQYERMRTGDHRREPSWRCEPTCIRETEIEGLAFPVCWLAPHARHSNY